MKLIKLSVVAALITTISSASDFEKELDVSANIAMTSNYVWRGMTQTDNTMATQGGFDLEYKGAYIGAWGSNVSFAKGMELDLYIGYVDTISDFSYDVGYVQYTFVDDIDSNNFGEVYVGLGYNFNFLSLSTKYSSGIKTNNIAVEDYMELAVTVPLFKDFSAAAHYGLYTDIGSDYSIGIGTSLGEIDLDLSYVGFSAKSDVDIATQDNIIFTLHASL